ncbi:MAG TPA: MarR family transcriptional regulator [Ornithinibacter sp.]|nr:MarR family transcriptional regulator [Ornithinibacter sp.]
MATTATRSTEPAPGAAPDLLALDRQVCFALAVASRTVIGLYRPLLEPMGLTHPQYLVMLALWEDEPLRVSELADRLSLEPATLSPLLKRLESAGLVTRRRDPHDERAVAVGLTPAGRRLRARAEQIPPAVMARLGVGLTELEELRDRLTTVIEAARRDG